MSGLINLKLNSFGNSIKEKLDVITNTLNNKSSVPFMANPDVLKGATKFFWSSVSTLPYDFYQSSAVVYNNEIHILGSGDSSYYTKHYKWDGSSWSSVSTLPYDFSRGCALVLNNEIHILGGDSGTTSHYKWNGSSWSRVSTLPYSFYRGSAVVYNNEIHILGSYKSNYYKYHYKWNGSSWSRVSTLPYDFYWGFAIVYNNEIHILGSASNNYHTKHYKWNGSSWSSVSTLPYNCDKSSNSTLVFNGNIHLLGCGSGFSETDQESKYHYKFDGSTWTSVSTLPYPFIDSCAVAYNNEIHILGSNNSNSTKHYSGDSTNDFKFFLPKKSRIYSSDKKFKLLSTNATKSGNIITMNEDGEVAFYSKTGNFTIF